MSVEKIYASVNLATGQFGLVKVTGDSDPTPPEGHSLVLLSSEVLNGKTPEEFQVEVRPIIDQGQVSGWEDRDGPLSITLSENPYDDGSNTPTVTITGGVSSGLFTVAFSRVVSMNLPSGQGAFDESGEASFKFKVIGQGLLSVEVAPRDSSDFLVGSMDIVVEPGPFA